MDPLGPGGPGGPGGPIGPTLGSSKSKSGQSYIGGGAVGTVQSAMNVKSPIAGIDGRLHFVVSNTDGISRLRLNYLKHNRTKPYRYDPERRL